MDEAQQQAALAPNTLTQRAPDEYTQIQQFIYDEMVRNSASPTVAAIKFANASPGDEPSKAAAYTLWAVKVRPNGDWDHKSDVLELTAGEMRGGADLAGHGQTDPGDDAAVRIGIELRQQYAPDQLRPEHIQQAIDRHHAELEQTGMIGPAVK